MDGDIDERHDHRLHAHNVVFSKMIHVEAIVRELLVWPLRANSRFERLVVLDSLLNCIDDYHLTGSKAILKTRLSAF